MPCIGCLEKPKIAVSAKIVLSRACAFDNDGTFTPENSNCVTMQDLYEMLPKMNGSSTYSSLKTEDHHSGSFGVFEIPFDANDYKGPGEFNTRLCGYVAMTYNSKRSTTKSVMVMHETFDTYAIRLEDAEAIIEAARYR